MRKVFKRQPNGSEWLTARRGSLSALEWARMPLHRQLGIVPEVREVATTDYVSGYGVNNHRFRYQVSVARAA